VLCFFKSLRKNSNKETNREKM